MPRRPRIVGLLWRWHRRLGVFAAVFVLLLVVTGVVLNHTVELGLDHNLVDSAALRKVYGDHSDELPAYQAGTRWLSRAANGRIYLDALEVAPCLGKLVGVLEQEGLLYAACAEELLVISSAGELVESVTASTGLPVPLTGLGLVDARVVLHTESDWWLADLEQFQFNSPVPGDAYIRQLAPGTLPQDIRRAIPAQEQWLTWERLLLDLHSGRLFGYAGVLLVDAIGLVLAALALSGISMWWLHRRRSPRG